MSADAEPDSDPSAGGRPTIASMEKAVSALALTLQQPMDQASMKATDPMEGTNQDPLGPLFIGAKNSGINLLETSAPSIGDIFATVRQGFPLTFSLPDDRLVVLQKPDGRKIDSAVIGDHVDHRALGKSELTRLLGDLSQVRMLVAKKEFECDSLSATSGHGQQKPSGDRPTPLRRLIALLHLDRRDIELVTLFAGVSGVLGLATPLIVESLVNVVSWGVYFQPLLVLASMLLICLGIAGFLKVLQTWVVEIIQRRQFVRIVNDLVHRFPRADQDAFAEKFPREFANRVFDTVTIQKATSVLLLDGVSIVLTTIIGLLLLAFYHPFLLGFDIVLVLAMISMTWILGRGGVVTAIDESGCKYRVAHWLQDVIAMPNAFKIGGGEQLAIQRANQLTVDYLNARSRQFSVVIRQVIFAVGLQVVASTALLSLGGWLVIDGQLTLGQLVASELVVTVVVGAFAKAGKSLEKFYDLMAGIDKVGYLLDIPVDPRAEVGEIPAGPAEVSWSDLVFDSPTGRSRVSTTSLSPGSTVAIVGDDPSGQSRLARALGGLAAPTAGLIQIAGYDAVEAALGAPGEIVAYAGESSLFDGTLRENIDLGRGGIDHSRVRDVLREAGLGEVMLQLKSGLNTRLLSDGRPFSVAQQSRLMIARALASRPRLLIINGLLDGLGEAGRQEIWKSIAADGVPWTLVIVTHQEDVAQWCDNRVTVRK
ncbi:ATP-binding cassette domain-containing protein [Allorhodopirellula solitaria]|uniref:Alpha-hemolysin translocation ATP-binding protein HlyB n=1 Tax=Allorhodopirellula solitaria TaxID=2527987 RepID=A0A5C5XP21_9BACT|nr:ATP-binding cassette domain-containing protein [Allorhodopirellula solitaria]TWT64654.1 Alpha-hemolysin translocation ATP-binding protein HlyB [Allorhodopirellula solitaria]